MDTGTGMVKGGKGCVGYCIRNRNGVSCYEAERVVMDSIRCGWNE